MEAQAIPYGFAFKSGTVEFKSTSMILRNPYQALSSCMTFLDLTEADKLAVVAVEVHVDPRRQCDALGN